ncbi:MAG: hypothetical protein GX591_18740 [Planctomycetes bacterium]|nr:hypothetical protein [Planctomycetota bacterium]
MGSSRFFGIVLVTLIVSAAWFVLGASVQERTESLDRSLSGEMRSLWGPPSLIQPTPYVVADPGGRDDPLDRAAPAASAITADIRHDHRNKGLLWYSTFTVDFTGRYTLAPAEGGVFVFPLPRGVTSYNNLAVSLDGNAVGVRQADVVAGALRVPLPGGAAGVVEVRYCAGGQDRWLYVPGDVRSTAEGDRGDAPVVQGRLSELSDFTLTVTTDFAGIDYPKGSRSPTAPAAHVDGGRTASWVYRHAVTSQPMGIEMPRRVNAGPIAARMSFFAPVSLAFFFTALFTVVVLKRIDLHPMHYLFIAAGFFAFHILMAYLADVVAIHASFWIAAAVSVALVASYMRLVAGMRFTLGYVCLAQLAYLVGFSYAFFWVGRTGLTVTLGAIATLFVLMQATGRLNWHEVFGRPHRAAAPIPAAVAAAPDGQPLDPPL